MTVHSPELVDYLYSQRGIKTCHTLGLEVGLSKNCVRKLLDRAAKKRGDPPLTPKKQIHTRELIDYLYSQRGIKPASVLCEEAGLSIHVIRKIWKKEKDRRGDKPMQTWWPREMVEAVYAARGHVTARVAGAPFGIGERAVKDIWRRERLKRGDPPLTPSRAVGVRKHSLETVAAIYALRGKKSARIIAREYGIHRNAVIGIWTRERAKRGDVAERIAPVERLACRPRTGRLAPLKAAKPKLAVRAVKVVHRPTRKDKKNPFAGLFKENTARPIRKGFSIREVGAMPINGTGVPLLELPPNGCRFPLGDWDAKAEFFCGDRTMTGCSYCEPHFALTHTQVAPWYEQEAA